MTAVAGGALFALALLTLAPEGSAAQDTVPVATRHFLPIDITRLQPYRRVYEMIVQTQDSATVVGERDVTLSQATYAGNAAWMLVEIRTGAVPAVETLYVAPDIRPLHWHSTLGGATLGVNFVGDTLIGAVSAPPGKQNLIVAGRADLLVSQAMIEMLLPLLPLTSEWTDSANVVAVDMATTSVIPVALSVIGEEDVPVDSVLSRPAWIVALRAESRTILFWVDKESAEVHKAQQPVPAHVGSLLEYRRRADIAPFGR